MAQDEDLRRWAAVSQQAQQHREVTAGLSDAELRTVRAGLTARRGAGEPAGRMMPEAFAAAVEAARRERGYAISTQDLMTGAALFDGRAVSVPDNGRNAVIAILPAFLAAIGGESLHLVTADQFVAAWCYELAGGICTRLGLTAALALPGSAAQELRRAFAADLVVASYLQVSFQCLASQLARDPDDLRSWHPERAVVDQIDAILVDHADDPLLIQAPMPPDAERFGKLAEVAAGLRPSADFSVDETTGLVSWSPGGLRRAAGLAKSDLPDGLAASAARRDLDDAVRARYWYRRGRDYRLDHGRIAVGAAPGSRLASSRRLRRGALQAVEARTGVLISPEDTTLARLPVRDLFRSYPVLSGLSGQAHAASDQLSSLYQLSTIGIEGGEQSRADQPDVLFERGSDRMAALAADAAERHRQGQPVIVATPDAGSGELAADRLRKAGIREPVLVSGSSEKTARSLAEAGRAGAATVLAGPVPHGLDIPVDADATSGRGLAVLIAGRGTSARGDQWLQGLSGRRGEPGETRFYLAADDSLLAGLHSWAVSLIPLAVRKKADGSPVSGLMTRLVASVQQSAEAAAAARLAERLRFEDIETAQRREIQQTRHEILAGSGLADYLRTLMHAVAARYSSPYRDLSQLARMLADVRPAELSDPGLTKVLATAEPAARASLIEADLVSCYQRRAAALGPDRAELERQVSLSVLDSNWRQHLDELEAMRMTCAASSPDPRLLTEFAAIAGQRYDELRARIATDTLGYLFYCELPG